jgi:murein DD-endopeptidase MepM/ murein hydrolase activator NlpD
MDKFIFFISLSFLIIGCPESEPPMCEEQANSPYVLPYPVGQTYQCWQGRFYGGHNRWNLQYAQDFWMPLRSVVTAAREGVVYFVDESVPENTGDDNVVNIVVVRHDDSTYARYVHLGYNSIFVVVNQSISKGDTLALTGNTGNTGGVPHLHFDVVESLIGLESQTIPVWFRNTKSHPNGVEIDEYYTAEQY